MLKTFSKMIEGAFRAKSGFDQFNSPIFQYAFAQGYNSQFNYPLFAIEGYNKNIIVNYCVSLVAEAVADLPYIVKIDGEDVTANVKNPIVSLLRRPTPTQDYKDFMMHMQAFKMVAGNTFIRSISISQRVGSKLMRLEALRPDWMTIEPNSFQEPLNYLYNVNGHVFSYAVDQNTWLSDILHLRYFNPINNLYGLSPIQVSMLNTEQHNLANEWNYNLLKNHAKPSGIISVKSESSLNKNQKDDIREKLKNSNQGGKNAGNLVVTGSDVSWISTSLTPAEMDWVNSKATTARDIALAFKVPPFLLGLPDGATFTNVAEAKLSLYEETVIPHAEKNLAALAYYIQRMTGANIELSVDKDQVSALMPRRTQMIANAVAALAGSIVTTNEARAMIGKAPDKSSESDDPADKIMVQAAKLPIDFSNNQLDPGKNPEDDDTGDDAETATPDDDETPSKPKPDSEKAFTSLIKNLEALKKLN